MAWINEYDDQYLDPYRNWDEWNDDSVGGPQNYKFGLNWRDERDRYMDWVNEQSGSGKWDVMSTLSDDYRAISDQFKDVWNSNAAGDQWNWDYLDFNLDGTPTIPYNRVEEGPGSTNLPVITKDPLVTDDTPLDANGDPVDPTILNPGTGGAVTTEVDSVDDFTGANTQTLGLPGEDALEAHDMVWDQALGTFRAIQPGERSTHLVQAYTDENGNVSYEIVESYEPLNALLDKLGGITVPQFKEWLAASGLEWQDIPGLPTDMPSREDYGEDFDQQTTMDPEYQALLSSITSLSDLLADGPSDGDLANADAYAATRAGFNDATEYQSYLSGLRDNIAAGPDAYQGFSDERRALNEKSYMQENRIAEERARRLIGNIGSASRSASRQYALADEELRKIYNEDIKRQLADANIELEMKLAQYDGDKERYLEMVNSGTMAAADFLGLMESSRSAAFEGYSTAANAMLTEYDTNLRTEMEQYGIDTASADATYGTDTQAKLDFYATQVAAVAPNNANIINAYRADLEGIDRVIAATYQAINGELGVHAQENQDEVDYYDSVMAIFEGNLSNISSAFAYFSSIEAWETAEGQEAWNVVKDVLGLLIAGADAASGFVIP